MLQGACIATYIMCMLFLQSELVVYLQSTIAVHPIADIYYKISLSTLQVCGAVLPPLERNLRHVLASPSLQ